MSAQLGPQNAGASGGVVPFWAASNDVVFDNFTSDIWTPGAAVANMFNGALAELKTYGFINKLWLKLVASAAGSTGGTFGADSPANFLDILRITDPNGHAIIDADSFGVYLLDKYCGRARNGDPFSYPNVTPTALGTTVPASPQFELLVPFCINEEIGLGGLSDMDASGPYKIVAQGAASAAAGAHGLFSTAPTTTTPALQVQVGAEFFSLPGETSRVNGQPQVQLPPLLDRGIAVVNEFTKQSLNALTVGTKTYKLQRVGNILRQVILVARNSAGARIDWVANVAAGTRISLTFDSIPLKDEDPQHWITETFRKQTRGFVYDTGVLVYDRGDPNNILPYVETGLDGGLDSLQQTAQTTALEITFNAGSTLAAGSVDVYTSDITVTNMVTGEKYAFAYGGQLLLPSPPGQIRS
ncbi:MAG: hypothetical protein ACRD2H_13925 [Terriglobales bacterium]